jgi:HAD superfamily hydrolase (TIGR01662 family)
MQEALGALGLAPSLDEVRAAIQAVWGDYYRDATEVTFPATREYNDQTQLRLAEGLLAHFGLATEPATVQAHTDHMDELFRRPDALRPFPDVDGVLTALKEAGYRLAIVSNWSWNLRERVAQTGLNGWFELVWASAYAGCNKPHPGIFDQALARMGLSPDRVLYVGDSYRHDVVGARNAGIDPVLLDRTGTAKDLDCPVVADLWGVLDQL